MKRIEYIKENFSKNLFWDIDLNDLNLNTHSSFILARVLDYGTWQDWKLLCSHYTKDEIKKAALEIRSMFPKSLNCLVLKYGYRLNNKLCSIIKNHIWSFEVQR